MSSDHATAAQRRLSAAAVPPGWTAIRLGDVFEQVVDRGHTRELPVLSVTMDEGVVRRDSLDRRNDREVDREDYLRVQPGDIAYNTMRMWQGASGLVREEGYVSPAYTVVRASPEESPEFWAHYFKHPATIRDFLDHSQGFAKDRYRLYFKHFASVPALRPPLVEQRKIAAALSSVDRVIEATETLAASLNRTTAALSDAIFSAALDQGADGLPLGELLETKYGTSAKCEHDPGGLPVLRIPNVCDRALDLAELKHLQPDSLRAAEREGLRLRDGDLLMVRSNGNPALVGRMAVFDRPSQEEWLYASFLIRLRVTSARLNPRFLWWFSQTRLFEDQARPLVRTSTGLNNINSESLQSIRIGLPSPERQAQIVAGLDAVRTRALTEGAKLACLRRLKLGLLQDVLTGRRRVTVAEPVVA